MKKIMVSETHLDQDKAIMVQHDEDICWLHVAVNHRDGCNVRKRTEKTRGGDHLNSRVLFVVRLSIFCKV